MSENRGQLERILREFRIALAAKVSSGRSLVDELLAERRQEAEDDEQEWTASRTEHRAKEPPTAD